MPSLATQNTSIFNVLMHEGLLTYNPKKSKVKPMDSAHRKGAVFVVRKKSDFTDAGVKGFIITSKETLIEQSDNVTHFTPNVFRQYKYADADRRYIKGFAEENLQQINVFVIDIDTKQHTVEDIQMACIDESIGRPTLILSTDRGYQVFFALEQPIFISNKNDFRSLKVAKRISENLKKSLLSVSADQNCNDFGFFRIPTTKNVVRFDPTATYSVKNLIDWSMRCDDDAGRTLYVVPQKMQISSWTQSAWFQQLVTATDVKGEKGQIGRNNTLFTLALVCYQDGKDIGFATDLLEQYNANLRYRLTDQEVNTIINSAYSGKYKGAKKEYIEQLLELYVTGGESITVRFGAQKWYKHKKARKDRERSHCHEWEQDIINYITAEKSVSEPFIWRTQKELCEAIGIPSSTLNKLLKESKKIIKTTTGKGRNAKTGWTTVQAYLAYIIWLKNDLQVSFKASLRILLEEHFNIIEPIAGYDTLKKQVLRLLNSRTETEQLSMFDTFIATG